jgi:hypothetical protein
LDREEREREREKARAQVYIYAKTGPLVMLDCYVEVALLVKEEKDY